MVFITVVAVMIHLILIGAISCLLQETDKDK